MSRIIFIVLSVLAYHTLGATAAKNIENSGSHHVTFGAQSPREVHLGRYTAMERFKPVKVVEGDFVYRPKPNDLQYSRTITRIVITDQYDNGNGGYATLKDGGPSTNFAIIHLKSQRNHGYNFVIDIYGI
ncbi:probable salivary secreted peptide [Musca domestica]|uniref:Probable salivary secreted peptide n=1 Tax=Musca domestica TaxID=7370 RepID=A0A1I8NEF3_MUSDO|nr:probable salivary secreted peptide [Musca domestica]XP_058976027.1 probable salivary secreted peptide [Musca domestica]